MSTKLTLTLEKEVIEKAKEYAHEQKRSLSNLIEEYLRSITEGKEAKDIELTPLVKSLKGSVKIPESGSFDEKQILEDELIKKYLG
ncbi:DUF6364 family protein [Arundinibacter roseus]|uniref:Antitoxin n=1 Tax=Arundinibacter roseus TaxID=2070510 RepID=A0A4R4K9E6_9BACT|nr:DUF6364 family protein [Arundinibacter roseus]TDB64123.1 hypothetical protein EZE20_14375 [Arundinibacter roseus]